MTTHASPRLSSRFKMMDPQLRTQRFHVLSEPPILRDRNIMHLVSVSLKTHIIGHCTSRSQEPIAVCSSETCYHHIHTFTESRKSTIGHVVFIVLCIECLTSTPGFSNQTPYYPQKNNFKQQKKRHQKRIWYSMQTAPCQQTLHLGYQGPLYDSSL